MRCPILMSPTDRRSPYWSVRMNWTNTRYRLMELQIISMTAEEFKSLVDAYCKDRKDPTPAQELIYLGEVQDKCPKCGKPLVRQGTRKVNKDFEIAHIFPCNPTADDMAVLEGVELYGQNSETMDNKIALCHDCHEDYDNNKTKEKYEYFLANHIDRYTADAQRANWHFQ